MKQTFTLTTLIVMVSLSSVASANDSRLHLDLFDDGHFIVLVDDLRYDNVTNGLDIGGLRPGSHHIEIIEVFHGRANRGRGRSTLYHGNINIPFRSAVFARLTSNLQLHITEIRSLQPPPRADVRHYDHHNGNRGNGGYNNRGYGNRGYGSSRGGYGGYGYGNRRSGGMPVIKLEMERTTMDRDKLNLAQSYVQTNAVSASEVASMMNLLSFEKNKLALAKYAYAKTFDKQNYHLVNRAFGYDSSVRELNQFIAAQRRR